MVCGCEEIGILNRRRGTWGDAFRSKPASDFLRRRDSTQLDVGISNRTSNLASHGGKKNQNVGVATEFIVEV